MLESAIPRPESGLTFDDLYEHPGLERLDALFVGRLGAADPALQAALASARANPAALASKAESELLLALTPHVEAFIAWLFGIETEVAALAAKHHELNPIYAVKRHFVQRKAMHKFKAEAALELDGPALAAKLEALFGGPLTELAFAQHVTRWQQDEAANQDALDLALRYAAWAALTPAGRDKHRAGVLFKAPHKLDPQHLVPTVTDTSGGYTAHRFPEAKLRRREGFKLTDAGTDLTGALDQAHYCIWCHEQGKDSCSKGLREKGATGRGEASFKKTVFSVTLAGCPLDEKISEFHKAKTEGLAIGALAIIAVDNPLCAATGHRICNDCMKACIYQKQEPVDIPQAETRTLKDVLQLPWGFEIYGLLTRWNPLNLRSPYPKPSSGKRVLIAGMGPAGFSLAHFLMNDGHTVVGIDGLKIEPLAPEISGVGPRGERVPFKPIRDIAELYEPLDGRVMAGFGGVAEYGITVRWDKNFLKIVRLLLERRSRFALFGGVRFGGTITAEEAFALGFDHVALAVGAGRPTVLDLPNGLARGVRTASDFLMALQLTGAAKTDSIANMQLRLPVVVIGGGLTAIDTATEALAYYPLQVEKFLRRYELLAREHGEAAARIAWTEEERAIADEFLAHARAIRAERAAAAAEKRSARVIDLMKSWGGVTIAYRRRLVDSPSYTLNHEEVQKALEEGITFSEGLTPRSVQVDRFGHAAAIRLMAQTRNDEGKWVEAGEVELPAKTILVAAGTQPNTVLAREDSEHFRLDGKYFQAVDDAGNPVQPEKSISKPNDVRVLLSRRADGRCMSYFGDVHPSYFGNVVKAMGSAKQGYPIVSHVLCDVEAASAEPDALFLEQLNDELRATVHKVERLTPLIVEVVVRAPLAARRFRPGQFYRLQNYETKVAERRRHAPRDGRARADRRVGGSPAGAHLDDRAGDGRLVGSLHAIEARRTCRAHGTDGHADGDSVERNRRACRRRARQRGAVFDRSGDARGGKPCAVFRGIQTHDGPLQDPGDRSGIRCRRVVLRRGARFHARPAAGQDVRRQHRAGDARVRSRRPGRAADRVQRSRSHHRDRLRPHDGRRRARAARRAEASHEAASLRHRLDQLADAMHDEGDLRAMPSAAGRSEDGRNALRLFVLQPGSAARSRRLACARCAVAAEQRAGEAHGRVGRSLPGEARE